MDAAYEKELAHKVEAFRAETRSKKSLWLTMLTFSGLNRNEHSAMVAGEITGEDLFSL